MSGEELLSALGANIGLPDLSFNDENVCRLILDDQTVMDLEYDSDEQLLSVYTVVSENVPWDPDRLRELLSANLFGRDTGGGVIALNEERDEILLTRTFDVVGISFARFLPQLELLIAAIHLWTNALSDPDASPGEDDSASPATSKDPGMLQV